jgi:acyl-CoA synthetase (AMP-forming)/AMP-acid ligase II
MTVLDADRIVTDRLALRQRWYDEGFYGSLTFGQQLRESAGRFPESAYVFADDVGEVRLSFRELLERAQRVSHGLRRLGVVPGDRVAIQVPNRSELVVAYYACFLAGAVVVPITHIYGPAEMSFILRQSGARLLVVPDRSGTIDFLDRVTRLTDVPALENVVVIGDARRRVRWSDLEEAEPVDGPEPTVAADDLCALLYTSGTTSAPKGVKHTHNSLMAEMRANITAQMPERDESTLVAWPAGHVAGLIGICSPMTWGNDSVVMSRWDPARAVDLIVKYRCVTMSGTPLHFTALMEAADAAGRDISSMRLALIGAANVPPALVERFEDRGFRLCRCYGSTEHPTSTSNLFEDDAERRAHTDGRPTPGNEVRLVDEHGADVALGEDGEIATRGPEQFVGYWDADLDRDAFLPGGWFLTGDIGRFDADGYMRVTDRRKDIIIRGGENIASKEVEDVLVSHPDVLEAAVVAAPDERYGEAVAAFVRLRPGTVLGLDEVTELFIRAGVARQKTPTLLHLIDELPRTLSGKVQKFELRALLREG